MTKDELYFICACREEGIVIFNFTLDKIKVVSLMKRAGCEYLVLSDDESHIFVAAGF